MIAILFLPSCIFSAGGNAEQIDEVIDALKANEEALRDVETELILLRRSIDRSGGRIESARSEETEKTGEE
ncbi:MAG: hypothetical protein NUW37_02960 [Planctomycetes bacterium]|nr:hypothetical protein [Planctomycetota bacterium]